MQAADGKAKSPTAGQGGYERLSWALKLAYSSPAIALAVVGVPIFFYLPAFYTDVVGVDPVLFAVIFLASRMFDGIATDRTVRPARDAAAAEAIIAERIAEGELKLERWDESVDQWVARVRCVAQWMPERELITYAPDELRVVLMEIASGATWRYMLSRYQRQ